MSGEKCGCSRKCGKNSGAIYCLGFIGAAIYYVSTSGGFWAGFIGIIKSFFWPGFIVFELLKFLGA